VTLRDYYNEAEESAFITQTGAYWYAQTFTATSAYNTDLCKIRGQRVGTPDTLTVGLRATEDGVPVGADLAVATTDGNAVTTDAAGEWITLTWESVYPLEVGTVYALVMRVASGDSDNRITWILGTTTEFEDPYAGGQFCRSTDSGSSWSAYGPSTQDGLFEVWGTDIVVDLTDIATVRRLCAASNNQFWYEDI